MSVESKFFICKDLNKTKYDLIFNKINNLLLFKNDISEIINNDLEKFIDMSLFDWINYFGRNISYCSRQDITFAIKEVHTSYVVKVERNLRNIEFKLQKEIKFYNYKKENQTSSEVILYKNKTTKCLSYLARYWNDNLISWLENNINYNDQTKQLRSDSLELYKKYPDKIKNLAKTKHDLIFSKIKSNKIIYNKLSYRSCNEITSHILLKNKKDTSLYNTFIVLGAQKTSTGKLYIPVKLSNDYHGTIESFDKQPTKRDKKKIISYQIEIIKEKEIKITLFKNVNNNEIIDKEEYYGVDVNVKNNLFCDKFGNTIDFDRDMLNDYVSFLKKIDNKKSIKIKTNQNISIKDSKTYDKWKVRIKDMLERKCRKLINQTISLGKNHLVLEDLTNFNRSFATSEEFQDIKYDVLIKILKLTSLKTILKRIGNKQGIQVTFVQSCYTSQTCKCGHISKNNRKTQEIFKCESCGKELNADINAASNIEDRLTFDVLRSSLLSKNKAGLFVPKILSREQIKFILYDFYSSQQKEEIVSITKH